MSNIDSKESNLVDISVNLDEYKSNEFFVNVVNNPTLTFQNTLTQMVLQLSPTGELEIRGNTSKCVDSIINAFRVKTASPIALEKTYLSAIEKCRMLLDTNSVEALKSILDEEILTRRTKIIEKTLKNNNKD